jgi:hypothetical protein
LLSIKNGKRRSVNMRARKKTSREKLDEIPVCAEHASGTVTKLLTPSKCVYCGKPAEYLMKVQKKEKR